MVMAKDPTNFRNRFKLYKEGKMPYENGLPKYAEGTEGWLPDYTMDYILALENPTKQGLVDGIWRPPTDSSKWDINAIGGGLDIRYKNNPLVYNFLSDNNRLNNPYLTEQEEYDLRKRTFNDTMLPALIRMHDKYGEQISSKGYARLAGMKWQGHPFLMAITPDSITGRAFLNAIESGDRDLDTVFNAYYRHPANAKKYAARIQSDENYWSNNRSINLDDVPIQSTLHPIVEKRDAVAVRKTIPKAKTRARWTGAENVSPYLTGKPILKLKKEIKTPNVVELHKESQWKAPMQFKNGKLPEYENGKTRNMKQENERDLMWYAKPFAWKYITNGLPIDTVRERLYNNLIPVSYRTNDKYPWTRARDAIVNNEKESLEKFDERQRAGALARDEIYAQYLHIPKNKRRGIGFELKDSKYKPTLNDKGEHYYSINFGEDEDKVRGAIINNAMKTSAVLDDGIDADGYSDFYNLPGLLPNQVKSSIVLNDLLGWHRVGRGIDPKKGDYVSYWDRWDLTPIGRTGEDQSMGIGTPVNIYDRIYLDDYYGVDSSAYPGTYYGGYLPEIEILPKHKDGKLPGYADGKIHIKPANRGKFTALKKRTGHSASWFKAHGTPAQKKMAVFALNAKKWKH